MTILEEASKLVDGDRRADYGPLDESMAAIAAVWNVVLKKKLQPAVILSPHDVALLMAGLKLCREANSHKRDNLVDGAAYLHIANLMSNVATKLPHKDCNHQESLLNGDVICSVCAMDLRDYDQQLQLNLIK